MKMTHQQYLAAMAAFGLDPVADNISEVSFNDGQLNVRRHTVGIDGAWTDHQDYYPIDPPVVPE